MTDVDRVAIRLHQAELRAIAATTRFYYRDVVSIFISCGYDLQVTRACAASALQHHRYDVDITDLVNAELAKHFRTA